MEYCRYCGTQLEDGQSCTCEKAVAQQNKDVVQKVMESDEYQKVVDTGKDIALTLMGQVKKVILNPAEGCKEMVQSKAFANGIILTAAQIILLVLLVMSYFMRMVTIESFFTFGKLFYYDMPFYTGFAFTFTVGVVAAALYFGAYFAAFMITGDKVDWKDIFCMMGVRNIPSVALLVVSMILMMFHPGLGFAGLFISMFTGVAATAFALEGIETKDKNKKIWVFFLVEVAVAIVLFVIMTGLSALIFPTFNALF